MSRFGGVGQRYFDNNGEPLSGGLLYFYETGTSTDKATYANSDETIQNPQPVVLDSTGMQPNVFFTGTARIELRASDGSLLSEGDPFGAASTATAFQAWNVDTTYNQDALVTRNSGFYRSIVNGNTGNDPLTSITAWEKVLFVGVYNANVSYPQDAIVQSGDKRLWISRVGNNLNNAPQTSPTRWRPLSNELWTDVVVKTSAFTAASGSRYLIDTSGGAFTMTLPANPVAGNIVGFVDEGQSWDSNNFTIDRNGSDIMGLSENLVCDKRYFSGALQFTTAKGWVLI